MYDLLSRPLVYLGLCRWQDCWADCDTPTFRFVMEFQLTFRRRCVLHVRCGEKYLTCCQGVRAPSAIWSYGCSTSGACCRGTHAPQGAVGRFYEEGTAHVACTSEYRHAGQIPRSGSSLFWLLNFVDTLMKLELYETFRAHHSSRSLLGGLCSCTTCDAWCTRDSQISRIRDPPVDPHIGMACMRKFVIGAVSLCLSDRTCVGKEGLRNATSYFHPIAIDQFAARNLWLAEALQVVRSRQLDNQHQPHQKAATPRAQPSSICLRSSGSLWSRYAIFNLRCGAVQYVVTK